MECQEIIRVLGYEEIRGKIKEENLEMQRTDEKITFISTIIQPFEKFDAVKDNP